MKFKLSAYTQSLLTLKYYLVRMILLPLI